MGITTAKDRNILTIKQRHELTVFVQENYTKHGAPDLPFARHATEVLGFEVNAASVKRIREAFGIARIEAESPEAMRERIRELEQANQALLDKCSELQHVIDGLKAAQPA